MRKPATNMQLEIRLKFLLAFALTFFCALHVKAQTACTQTLKQARTAFDEGRIHEIEGRLANCFTDDGFTDEEKTEAYRLLILSYIYLDESEKADNAMLSLLKFNHGYEINPQADPEELINLYATFRTKPIFYWGVRGGFNTTFVNVIKAYGVHSINNSSAKYANRIGFSGGLLIEKSFTPKITVRSDIQYLNNTFDYQNSFFQESTTGGSLVTSTATEVQTSVGISFMAHYSFYEKDKHKKGFKKLNPYVGLGGSVFSLLSSQMTFDVTNNAGASPDGPTEDLIKAEIRKKLNPTIDLEVGIKRKAKLNYINAGFRYSYGILDITDKHYDNGRLSTFYGFAANDIKTHSISIFIGILIPQYVPKKLTK